MPSRTITTSPNIATLDFAALSDYCSGYLVLDLSPSVWIGSGANNVLGASFKITNPYGVVISYPTTSGYDIYPPMTGKVYRAIPTQASNFQYGTYTVEVFLTDANGTIYDLIKPVKLSPPNPKNKNVKFGSLSAVLDGDCLNGKVSVIADTPPTYNGEVSDSQVNDFTLEYPTSSGKDELETGQGSFSATLFEGVYKFTGTICAHYSLGDNIFANVNYKVKREKNIRCLLDKSCIAARWVSLQEQLLSDCTDAEKIQTQGIILESMFLVALIDSLANEGQDPSDFIAQLETVLGCICTCNCADGTPIINANPTGDFLIEGCNVTSEVVDLTTVYTIENYRYVTQITNNGGAITITAPTLNDCTQTQVITFNIATVYTQIKAQIVDSTQYDYWASVINNTIDLLDISCLNISQGEWDIYTFDQRMQAVLDQLCIGSQCSAEISTPVLTIFGNNVTISWTNVADVYEVTAYIDGNFKGSVLYAGASFIFEGAADGDEHTYRLVPKCENGAIGLPLSGAFTYFGCPAIAVPTVSDTNVEDAACPYDLTALVSGLPMGIIAEWHNLNNTNVSSLVANPTSVTNGVFYVFAQNSEGCYSLGVQVILTCSSDTTCSAPQNLIVESITDGFRVRFQGAAFPPPSNSYTVKRRLTSDPDISGSYTTIGTPTWNASAARWEILDNTGSNNISYTYRAISNCTSSAPYVDYVFANIACPALTLNPDTNSVAYSFVPVGGGVTKYEISIYEDDGVTLIHTDTKLPAFSNPSTGTFIYLTSGTIYFVRLKIFIDTYSVTCDLVSVTTDSTSNLIFENGITSLTVTETHISTGSYYSPVSGSMPLATDQSLTGLHGTFTAAILFTTSGSYASSNVKATLYKNEVFVECISVVGASLKTFASHSFLSTDNIRITLITGAC